MSLSLRKVTCLMNLQQTLSEWAPWARNIDYSLALGYHTLFYTSSPMFRALALLICMHGCLAAESRHVETYPATASKKGLQVEMVDDALTLGVKHAALNVNLSQLVDPARDSGEPSWETHGRAFDSRSQHSNV